MVTTGRVRVGIRAMGKLEPNIHVDDSLLARAQAAGSGQRAAGILADCIAERAIQRETLLRMTPEQQAARSKQWAEENAAATKAHHEQIEKHGVFGDDLRTW